MYTYSEYVECREHRLNHLIGPMTLAMVMTGPDGGMSTVQNPTTVVGLLDAAIILMNTNGFSVEHIKQAIREHYDRVESVVEATEKLKVKAKVKIAEMRQQAKLKQQRLGVEVPDSELPPAPTLAIAPVSEPPTSDSMEWPKKES